MVCKSMVIPEFRVPAGNEARPEGVEPPDLGFKVTSSEEGRSALLHSMTYPNLQYVEIPGTGHFLMMEKSDEFNRYLLDFLTTLSFR